MDDHKWEAESLLSTAEVRNKSELTLAAAQVHATLAVEQAVRDQTVVLSRLLGDQPGCPICGRRYPCAHPQPSSRPARVEPFG